MIQIHSILNPYGASPGAAPPREVVTHDGLRPGLAEAREVLVEPRRLAEPLGVVRRF
jgi:hypothetical protein